MHKAKEVTDSMIEQYLSSSIGSECFELSYSANKIYIKAGSQLAALWAGKQASMAIKSGYISEVLGKTQPLYPLRPLWIKAGDIGTLSEKLILSGFNSLVLEDDDFEVREGLSIIRKPNLEWNKSFSPLDEAYTQYLTEFFHSIDSDFILWESRFNDPSFFSHEKGEFLTYGEILEKEMELLERILDKKAKLIYHLPNHRIFSKEKQCKWLKNLCHSAGKNTIIAFSLQEFWDVLRKSLDPITASLMPLVNCETSLDELDRIFINMKTHHFYGAITVVNKPPKEDMHLWMIGQLQLKDTSTRLLADIWNQSL